MKGKVFKFLLLLLFASIILFPALFKTVRAGKAKVGCVYSLSTGETLGWIPGDGAEHSIWRFRGYREMIKGLHDDKISIAGKTFTVRNEPIHNDAEAELYSKYGWDYFPKLVKPLIDEHQKNLDVKTDSPVALRNFLSENSEVKKYLVIKSASLD